MSKHEESKLPAWARKRFNDLRREIDRLRTVETAHAVLIGREWFNISGPITESLPRHLWFLHEDRPFPVCSLSHGDVLLIGRSRHRWGGEPIPITNGCGGPLHVNPAPTPEARP